MLPFPSQNVPIPGARHLRATSSHLRRQCRIGKQLSNPFKELVVAPYNETVVSVDNRGALVIPVDDQGKAASGSLLSSLWYPFGIGGHGEQVRISQLYRKFIRGVGSRKPEVLQAFLFCF